MREEEKQEKKISKAHWNSDDKITTTIKRKLDKINLTTSRNIINEDWSKPHKLPKFLIISATFYPIIK